MFNRSLFVALLLSAQSWALQCSTPVTLSDSRLDAYDVRVAANEKGDAVVGWLLQYKSSERLEVSYRTQGSPWSSPESLSDWEQSVWLGPVFMAADGRPIALWELNGQGLSVAEKMPGQSWSHYPDWAASENMFSPFRVLLDHRGNLLNIGNAQQPVTTPYKSSVPALAILVKEPGSSEQKWAIEPQEDAYYLGCVRACMNKAGEGYVFWVHYEGEEKLLMGQKIADGHWVGEREKICSCSPQYGVFENAAALNEQGDVALTYLDAQDHCYAMVKIGDTWTEPVLLTDQVGSSAQIAIDHLGNTMVVYETADDFETAYKPVGQPWQTTAFSSTDNLIYRDPQVQSDGQGNFVMIWQQIERGFGSIWGSSFSAETGNWSHSQCLSPEGLACFRCSYTFWAPGKGTIAWTMSPNGFSAVVQVAELSQ